MLRSVFAAFAVTASIAAQLAVPFGEILPDRSCEQEFTATQDGLQGLAVPIATYGRSNRCTLQADIFAGEVLLASRRWPAAELVDNAEIHLPCAPQPDSRGRRYRLVLRSADATPGNAVTAWIEPDQRLRLRPSFAGDTLALGELHAGVRVVQTFEAEADGLCGVQVLLTDFGRRNRGTLRLRVLDPLAGRELAARTVDAATVGNEDWRALAFAPVADSRARSFALELESADGAPGQCVTAYLDRGASYRGELSRNGAPHLGRLMLAMTHGDAGLPLATLVGGGLAAAALLLLGLAAVTRCRGRRGGRLVAAALVPASALLVGYAYGNGVGWLFWLAGAGCCAALLRTAAGAQGRRRVFAVQLAMVPTLLFVALAIAQPFGAARAAASNAVAQPPVDLDLHRAPWAFDHAKGDPAAFQRWWQRLTGEWNAPDRGCALVQRPDPLGELPFVLQPDSSTRFFDSTIRVNNVGCRGEDVAPAKGDAFRIVCLGESTTMGQTLFATDRPWPEVLEERLNRPERRRRIEVINAGWASYDVRHAAIRLRRFVLDLQPDLVVVYHGYNGFWMLLPDVAPALVAGAKVPRRIDRPSWLLADAEFGLRTAAFRAALGRRAAAPASDAAPNACGAAYREIVDLCAQRGARVALCSFNMAVREDTPPEVIEFYRAGFPQVERQIAANTLQTALLRTLATGDGRVTFVDSSRDLDGAYADAYVDLVHFTQSGRDRLARNIAAGIEALLPE
jgi:lysophospholipase L1-like esterase